MSVLISITLIAASLLLNNRPITTGLIIGSAVSLLSFSSIWWTITIIFQKKKKHNPFQTLLAILVYVIKLPIIGIALYIAFQHFKINLFALITGLTVMLIAVVFIGISNLFIRRGALK